MSKRSLKSLRNLLPLSLLVIGLIAAVWIGFFYEPAEDDLTLAAAANGSDGASDGAASDSSGTGSADAPSSGGEEESFVDTSNVLELTYTGFEDETGHIYIQEGAAEADEPLPLVLALCSMGSEAEIDVDALGWKEIVATENIIVIAPDYDNYSQYDSVNQVAGAISYAVANYPVDTTRIYSAGFSNGGATSLALASTESTLLAGFAAAGWLVDMEGQDASYDIPFMLMQGTDEFVFTTDQGEKLVMPYESAALHSLFVYNEMISEDTKPDYTTTPYWGYEPDKYYITDNRGDTLYYSLYYKEGYTAPFAQLILIQGGVHTPHSYEAEVMWDFLKHFSRNENGEIVEITYDNELK